MAETAINYHQSDDDRYVGIVVFGGDAQPANGRLDEPGAQVLATGFEHRSDAHGVLRVLVQCRRRLGDEIQFVLTFINKWGAVVREIRLEGDLQITSP